MPFLAVSGALVEPPVEPPVVDPGTDSPIDPGPIVEPVSGATLTLTTADGTVFGLGDWNRLTVTVGRKGFDAATYQVYADESPMVDGEIFRGARAEARDLVVPIYLRADTREEFLARKRELLSKLAPTRGLATLEVAEVDGSRRRIGCYFTGRGAEGDTGRGASGRTWVRYNLELRCPEPYWRGDPMHVEFTPPAVGSFFPIFPLRLQGSQSFGSAEFVNPGDVTAYPIWTVVGPTSGLVTITRSTPGASSRTLGLNLTLAVGQWVRIDTRPDRLSIVDQGGANRWPTLVDGASLWRIDPGTNVVAVAVAGAGDATRVVLDAEPRFETA